MSEFQSLSDYCKVSKYQICVYQWLTSYCESTEIVWECL